MWQVRTRHWSPAPWKDTVSELLGPSEDAKGQKQEVGGLQPRLQSLLGPGPRGLNRKGALEVTSWTLALDTSGSDSVPNAV